MECGNVIYKALSEAVESIDQKINILIRENFENCNDKNCKEIKQLQGECSMYQKWQIRLSKKIKT